MKIIYLSLLGLAVHLGTFGQQLIKTPVAGDDGIRSCGQHEALEKMQAEDPTRYQLYQQSRLILEQQEASVGMAKSNTIYTVPVVFHILHNNGVENISDAQIQDALNILNRDFRKQNSDVNNVVSQFLPIADDAKIEFAFAKIAPNGACFNGITRTTSSQTNNGDDGEAQVNAIINGNNVYQGIWPHNKYLNIYVCRNLISGAAGYTFLPQGGAAANATNMYYNGIFMLHSYVGSIGTSSVQTSRALTHEVGHWLNLDHVWGPGSIGTCGTDNVSDTPQTNGSNGVCNLNKSSCDGTLDNVENYMDYSYCSKMFTQGQVTRMRNAIVSNVAGRSNTWTTANLQSVGVIPGGTSLCSANIEATQTGICSGTSTTFSVTNVSTPITSYSWSFPGGTPATSTAASPTITYNTPGTYDVSVTITTSSGTSTLNQTSYITVASSQPGASLPFTEGFTSTSFPPANWTIDNGGASVTWVRRTGGTAPSGSGSAAIDHYNTNTTGDIDDLNTPTLNLSGYTGSTLTFDVAYRPYTGQSDKLEVLVATGCAGTYEVVYSKAGTTLQTESSNQNPYTSPSTWRNETVNLAPYVGNNQVKVKFRTTSGYGNYIYIDNVNVTGTTGSATANFSSSSNTVCVGQTVTYTNTSSGATSWNWNFGAGATPATATGQGPHTVTYSSPGAKNISLSINGGASTSNQSITVNQLPTVTMATLPTVCVNQGPITLSQGSPAGGTYSGQGVTGNQFTPSVAGTGTKTITYTYTATTGCTNTATGQIIVDGCLSLGTEENTLFTVYPNPTSGNVTVTSEVAIDELIILDNVGRVVEVIAGDNATEIQVNLSHLSAGSYHIHTKLGANSNITKLIIR